jgi:serine/threonine protein phosphatase PrpC
MTTDGLHGPVGDHVIDVMLDGHETMKLDTVAAQLLEAALGAGGRDNITLALGRYDES